MKIRWYSAVAAVALIAATQVAVQWTTHGTSSAALPGAVARSNQSSPFSSTSPKTIEAECPAGTRVTGGGGRVTGFTEHVVLTGLEPRHSNNPGSLDKYIVTAIEDEVGQEEGWAVTAYALCATASASLGIQIVQVRSDTLSPRHEQESVNCPGQKVILGTGARINGGGGQVHLTELGMGEFSSGVNVSSVTAEEDNTGFGGQWSLEAFAVCASVPHQNHTIVSGFAPEPGSADRKVAPVTCPAGMTVTGGGATVLDPNSGRVVLERILPEFLVGGVPGDEVTAVARENVSTDGFWQLMVEAACVA
jgi:hypothetical protein